MEPEQQREIASRGGRSSHVGRSSKYEEEDYGSPRSRSRYEKKDEDYGNSPRSHVGSSRRGFAAMDPERQREIASEGGRAPHRGPRGFAAMDEDEQREIASEGGRAPHRGPRGFAAMEEDEQREIASRGGRASHGGWGRDYESEAGGDHGYQGSSSSRGASSRRGFAAMEPEQRRETASRGDRSSHVGGHSRSSRDDDDY